MPRSWAYMVWLAEQNGGGIPAVHPIDSFATSWPCFYLDMTGQGQSRTARRLRTRAIRSWTKDGASYSDEAPIPNADDTALNFLIQRNAGLSPDPQVFAPFITEQGARCYLHEHDMSSSANVDVLLALRVAAPTAQRDAWIASVLRYLNQAARQRPDGLLTDKWHASPLYTTSRAILATHGLDDQLWARLRDALLEAQRSDGSWGSAEETAYGLHALCLTDQARSSVAIRAGAAALRRLRHQPWPALWIGKSLYLPRPVVAYAIIAAEFLIADLN
jgi:halimadienyl-diphosphate synthase